MHTQGSGRTGGHAVLMVAAEREEPHHPAEEGGLSTQGRAAFGPSVYFPCAHRKSKHLLH